MFLRPERTTSTPSSIFFRSSFPFIGDVSSDHCTRRIANANEEIITVTIKLSTQSIIGNETPFKRQLNCSCNEFFRIEKCHFDKCPMSRATSFFLLAGLTHSRLGE
jgi:hypothetical protein